MLDVLFRNVIEVTLASSVVIILLLTLSKVLSKNFTAKWRYWVWLIIAIRLALPVNFTFASPPVQLSAPDAVAVLSVMTPEQQSLQLDTAPIGITNNPASTTDSLANRNFQLTGILSIVWIAGASIFILWQLLSYALFRRLIKSNCKVVNQEDVISIYNDLCLEMKIKRKIPLMTCNQISSPLVLGIRKQVLLLPEVAFTPLQLKMVLCHELIHVLRSDILYKTLFLLVRAIHWFNPIVYLLAVEANKDVETSCDAAVVESQNASLRKEYCKAILLVIDNNRRSQVSFSTHFKGGRFMIMKRLESLFDTRQKRKGIVPFVLIILVISIIGLCVSCDQNIVTTKAPEITTTITSAETTAESDLKLLGKWVEETAQDITGLPLDSIEFFADGKTIIAGADNGTYKIVDEKLQCSINHEVYTGDYKIDGAKLTIYKDNGEFKVYIKTEMAAESDPRLLGKWVEETALIVFGLPLESIEFFADGKTIIAGTDIGTYKIVDGKLQCSINHEVYTGNYEIDGVKLTIYKDNGEFKVYIKE